MVCLLGETCTLLYGVLKWETAGEPPMTLMIHGKGENYALMEQISIAISCVYIATPIQIFFI